MHQIRVHLAARGWPVVGDPVYGEPRWSNVRDPVLATALRTFPRQALHAWRVALTHPSTGARLLLEAPAPRDLAELLTATGLSGRADRCSIHLHRPGEPIGATLRSSLTRALEQRWLA
jgi:hypothetical protein